VEDRPGHVTVSRRRKAANREFDALKQVETGGCDHKVGGPGIWPFGAAGPPAPTWLSVRDGLLFSEEPLMPLRRTQAHENMDGRSRPRRPDAAVSGAAMILPLGAAGPSAPKTSRKLHNYLTTHELWPSSWQLF
jgi:hypothetical protein